MEIVLGHAKLIQYDERPDRRTRHCETPQAGRISFLHLTNTFAASERGRHQLLSLSHLFSFLLSTSTNPHTSTPIMVQDPNFWRRFSVAVHQDDLSKEQAANRPDLKHSYVYPSTSTCTSAPLSPTSQCHLSPAFPASPVTSMSIMSASTPALATLRREEVWQAEIEAEKAAEREREAEQHRQRQQQQRKASESNIRRPSKLKKSASRASTRPLLRRTTRTSISLSPNGEDDNNDDEKFPHPPPAPPRRPSFPTSLRRPSLPGFRSPSALSLSGRPRSAFKTWTTITANPNSRDSWLEGQKKKRRQRTWICWCFWLCVFALVAGVVVAVVVLRAHGII